jgi:hypothetical protein
MFVPRPADGQKQIAGEDAAGAQPGIRLLYVADHKVDVDEFPPRGYPLIGGFSRHNFVIGTCLLNNIRSGIQGFRTDLKLCGEG